MLWKKIVVFFSTRPLFATNFSGVFEKKNEFKGLYVNENKIPSNIVVEDCFQCYNSLQDKIKQSVTSWKNAEKTSTEDELSPIRAKA